MVNRNWVLGVMVGFSVLSGCGKKAAPFTPITYTPQAQTQTPPPPAPPAFLSSEVLCAEEPCESTLALAVSLDPSSKPTPCSAALVANDLVALPASCLSADLQVPGKSCADRAFFFFGKTADSAAIRVGCSEIVEIQSSLKPNETDLAIVRLSDSARRSALRLAADGWTDTAYTVWSLSVSDAAQLPYQALLKKSSGLPAYKTAITPSAQKNDSAVMSLIRTSTENALPGSIALNAAGDAIGIMKNAFVTKLPYDQFEKVFQPLAVGSNLRCSKTLVGASAEQCQTSAAGSVELFTQSLRESAYESFTQELFKQSQLAFSDEIKSVFQWKTFVQDGPNLGAKKRTFIVPTCFYPEKLWSYKFKAFWGGMKSSVTLIQELLVYSVAEGLNRYYQPEVRKGNHHVSTVNLAIEFSPANFVKNKSSEVIVYTDSRTAPLEKSTLRACSSL